MRKQSRRTCIFILVSSLLLSIFVQPTYASTNVGSPKGYLTSIQSVAMSSAVQMPPKYNVSVNKEWTISFSKVATMSNIEAIVIEKDGEFIPSSITVDGSAQAKIRPVYPLIGNASYWLKVVLTNGKMYSMNFTTAAGDRNGDKEPNDLMTVASQFTVGENLTGSLNTDSDVDWYKFNLSQDGNANIVLTDKSGENINISLYGKDGNNSASLYDDIRYYSSNSKSIRRFSKDLAAGTYYFRISGDKASDYTLNTEFTANTTPIDGEGNSTYVNALTLGLQDKVTGHIGYYYDDRHQDQNDWYKIILDSDGQLAVDLESDNSQVLDLLLYGQDADNADSITSDASYYSSNQKSIRNLSTNLQAGVYYVKVYSNNPGGYTLKTNWVANTDVNDSSGNDIYTRAQILSANTTITGHIGYTAPDRSKDTIDWYKVQLLQKSTFSVDVTHTNGAVLDLALFGSDADNKDALASDSSYYSSNQKSVRHVSASLEPGTYYIRVTSNNPGSYILATSSK